MGKNYKLLLVSKEISKYFNFAYKNSLDIYDSRTMEYNLRTTWAELTYDDLKVMNKTIKKDINNNSYLNSIYVAGFSIIFAIAIAFVATFVGMHITDQTLSKSDNLLYLKVVSISLILLVCFILICFYSWNKKTVKLQSLVCVLKDIKKSEQNT